MTLRRTSFSLRLVAASVAALSLALPASAAQGLDSLAMEVIPAPRPAPRTAAARTDSAARVSPAAKAPRPAVKAARKPPIDVRALASEQTNAGFENHTAAPVQAGERKSGVFALVSALIVAGVSTLLILLLVARRSARRRIPSAPVSVTAPLAGEEETEESPLPADAQAEEEDSFFGVGRDLRSARGEMDLAMRLHAGSMGDGSRRRARSACSADATIAQRVKVAKRLGIGRGEIDLALRLQKLEIVPTEGEKP
ncbi:MAG TPA: hypothetical protein VMF59_10015 [Bacteroidota bacterium]|nr:hypothetical protein [Bacteroidota bacterium]